MAKLSSVFSIKIFEQEFTGDITSFELTADDSDGDSTTFSEVNQGANTEWTLGVTALFDGGSDGSLHDVLWRNAGSTGAFIIQPKAGTSSATNPQYHGTIRLPFKPPISIEAGSDSTFEYEFKVIGQPTKFKNGEESNLFSSVFNEYF